MHRARLPVFEILVGAIFFVVAAGALIMTRVNGGIALLSTQFDSESTWFAAADQACYRAKREGKGLLRIA